MNKEKIILIVILFLGLFIRLYNVNQYPPLLWDEAALGYNSYSILQTGRDEYGKLFPLVFKSFGDYKPGLYVYLTLPFVAIFGLRPLSVRLPSIILGSLLPLLAYIVAKKLSKSKYLPLIFSLIIAFNPYNIHYSRGAWETNILTFELLLASFLFLSQKYLFSSLVFGLTLYTYQSGKIISLLLILGLFALSFTKKFIDKKLILKFILPLFIFSLPILYGLFFQQEANRLGVLSLFSYPRSSEEKSIIISEGGKLDYNLFHNPITFFLKNFLSRYFNHFSPQFLLTQGDWQNLRHSAPYNGVLLLPSIIFLLIGVFKYLTKDTKNHLDKYFFYWLLISPLPAALTRDEIQATRIMSFSLPLTYFVAYGINEFFQKYKSLILKILVIILYLLSLYYYLDLYFVHMVKKSPQSWLYGYQQAMDFVINNPNSTLNYFTDFYGQPYIYYLFYSRYQPQKYQLQDKLDISSIDTGKVHRIDQFLFENPNYNHLLLQSQAVIGVFSYEDTIIQGIDRNKLIPLSPINNLSTFYGYKNF